MTGRNTRVTLAQKQEMLRCLERYAGGVSQQDTGICGNLHRDIKWYARGDWAGYYLMQVLMARATKTWKHYSGDIEYPVRGGCVAFNAHKALDSMWSGVYGKWRYQLLDRLIAELKREMSRNHRSMRVSLKKG